MGNTLSWIFYSASSLKQQSADRHVAPLEHISQPVFALSPWTACLAENLQIHVPIL